MRGDQISFEEVCMQLNKGGWHLAGGWQRTDMKGLRIEFAGMLQELFILGSKEKTDRLCTSELTARIRRDPEPWEIRIDGAIPDGRGGMTKWQTSHLRLVHDEAKRQHQAAVAAAKKAAIEAAEKRALEVERLQKKHRNAERLQRINEFLALQMQEVGNGKIAAWNATETGIELEFENGFKLFCSAESSCCAYNAPALVLSGKGRAVHRCRD